MFDRLFGSQPINLLEKALAGSSLRHKVISNNIANINTPGYKRMEVSFEEELAAVAQRETRQSGISLTHTNTWRRRKKCRNPIRFARLKIPRCEQMGTMLILTPRWQP